jgi:hypothetical protein
LTQPAAERISLSGSQPETCELLRQYLLLEPGKHYRLRWQARTRNLSSPTGLAWTIAARTADIAYAGDWAEGTAEFVASGALLPLTLVYRRPSGQARAEGSIEIRNVALTSE